MISRYRDHGCFPVWYPYRKFINITGCFLNEPPDLHLIPSWGVPPHRGFPALDIRSGPQTQSQPSVSAACRHPREDQRWISKNFPNLSIFRTSPALSWPQPVERRSARGVSAGAPAVFPPTSHWAPPSWFSCQDSPHLRQALLWVLPLSTLVITGEVPLSFM